MLPLPVDPLPFATMLLGLQMKLRLLRERGEGWKDNGILIGLMPSISCTQISVVL